MKLRNKIFFIIAILIIIAIAVYVFYNLNNIKTSAGTYILIYGYPAILLFSFLSELIDQPIGPETIGSLGVALGLNVFFVFILAIAGGWASNLVGFNFGRKYLSSKLMNSCYVGEYKSYCRLFEKYGKWSLLFSAILFPYIIFIWISGAFQMKTKDFFWYGMIPRMIRTVLVLGIVRIVI